MIVARTPTERGQVLIVFVLALGVLLGFVAMAIDVGLLLHERRSLQNAADAAALAGVQDLPLSPQEAVTKARDWLGRNGVDGDATVTMTTPYKGNPNSLEVVVQEQIPFLFARVLGKESASVKARAVASRSGGTSFNAAFLVLDEQLCKSFGKSGSAN
ncbi:MAG TPA: pilus assembly protein TadG-related protein, partial [Dehalococcoidia bacterium]|nr:pilus assembly protein TadG-related protein [Dehalococcoidia bacterium]